MFYLRITVAKGDSKHPSSALYTAGVLISTPLPGSQITKVVRFPVGVTDGSPEHQSCENRHRPLAGLKSDLQCCHMPVDS